MQPDLQAAWPWIVRYFEQSLKRSIFYTFATVDADGSPHLAPYASLVLNDDCTGYYSDVFPNHMSRNLAADRRVCIMVVNSGMWYWLKGVFRGRFDHWPGIRLYGTVDESRPAKPGEVERWRVRVRLFKPFKGYNLIWRDINTVRDIRFTHYEPVRVGPMTRDLRIVDPLAG
jgi:predicted pyridoxine 5'-phosphate oxidase superfamily flavin-nucleotide-binding protein